MARRRVTAAAVEQGVREANLWPADVSEASRGMVGIDDVVGIAESPGGQYDVLLIAPETGGYDLHDTYGSFERAMSEVLGHLARYRQAGEHHGAYGTEYAMGHNPGATARVSIRSSQYRARKGYLVSLAGTDQRIFVMQRQTAEAIKKLWKDERIPREEQQDRIGALLLGASERRLWERGGRSLASNAAGDPLQRRIRGEEQRAARAQEAVDQDWNRAYHEAKGAGATEREARQHADELAGEGEHYEYNPRRRSRLRGESPPARGRRRPIPASTRTREAGRRLGGGAPYGYDMNRRGAGPYWVWRVQRSKDEPYLLAGGPHGPHDLDGAKTFARIGATEGTHDRAVSKGRDPQASGFEIIRVYQAGTGKRSV